MIGHYDTYHSERNYLHIVSVEYYQNLSCRFFFIGRLVESIVFCKSYPHFPMQIANVYTPDEAIKYIIFNFFFQ